MSNSDCVIILDRASTEQRNAVHELIKVNSRGWWHRFIDVWIASGKTVEEWRDLIAPAISNPASVLVIKFPEKEPGNTRWASSGPNSSETFAWFRKNL